MRIPGYFRLLASLFYEALLLVALLFVATFVFVLLFGEATQSPKRYFLQAYLWCLGGGYFGWNWSRGRTLAMQAWKMRLVNASGGRVSLAMAMQRYLLASLGLLAGGVGFFWALLDRENLYLHDRLLGTRLVLNEKVLAN